MMFFSFTSNTASSFLAPQRSNFRGPFHFQIR